MAAAPGSRDGGQGHGPYYIYRLVRVAENGAIAPATAPEISRVEAYVALQANGRQLVRRAPGQSLLPRPAAAALPPPPGV